MKKTLILIDHSQPGPGCFLVQAHRSRTTRTGTARPASISCWRARPTRPCCSSTATSIPATIYVRVTDSKGNPLAGRTIFFEQLARQLDPPADRLGLFREQPRRPSRKATNANGEVSVTFYSPMEFYSGAMFIHAAAGGRRPRLPRQRQPRGQCSPGLYRDHHVQFRRCRGRIAGEESDSGSGRSMAGGAEQDCICRRMCYETRCGVERKEVKLANFQNEREQLAQLEWLFQQKKFAEGLAQAEAVLEQFPASFQLRFLKFKFLRAAAAERGGAAAAARNARHVRRQHHGAEGTGRPAFSA